MTGPAPAAGHPAELRRITDREFRLFQQTIRAAAGIYLSDIKRELLVGRLSRRLRQLGLTSFEAYHRRISEDEAEQVRMLDAICTNETHFFREPQHFRLLEDRILPALEEQAARGLRARRLRVWSAACSTGEEPFSLAMTLLDRLGQAGWAIEVHATDLSTKALGAAQASLWPIQRAAEIPERLLKRYMLRGIGPQLGTMKAGPELREVVRFSRLNLNQPTYPIAGPFDLIFCRNVLIYFDAEGRSRVVARLLDLLAPDGYLFLGHAETLMGVSDRVRSVIPTVYQPIPRPRAPGAPQAPAASLAAQVAGMRPDKP